MRTTADVVVIGAGVIGSSIALELTRAGRDVVVVDKAGGIGHGSTSASSAIIRFNYSTWSGVAAAWESWHCWTHWREHLGHEDRRVSPASTGPGCWSSPAAASRPPDPRPLRPRGRAWELWDDADSPADFRHLDAGSFGPPEPVDAEAFFDAATGWSAASSPPTPAS